MIQLKIALLSLSIVSVSLSNAMAHGENDVHKSTGTFSVSISKGQRVVIDVLDMCRQSIKECEASQLRIKTHPLEGLLFEGKTIGIWAYQHAGTSDSSDSFEISRIKSGEAEVEFSVSINIDTIDAKIVILEPAAGSSLSGGKILVSYTTSGTAFDHLHLQINEEKHVSLYSKEGQYEFSGLKPGRYIISATLARRDHRIIPSSRKMVEVQLID